MKKIIIILSLVILSLSVFYVIGNFSEKVYNNEKKEEVSKHELSKQQETWGFKDTIINSNIKNKKKVKVAILDSGINKEHPDLKREVKHEFNAVNSNQTVEDKFNHGTSIAGIIAAKNNKIGIRGIVPSADIYSVKVLNDEGIGSVDNIVKGIEWSINQDVKIINLSFGMEKDSAELKRVIPKAISQGIIIVAASGNNYMKDVDYPAKYPNVISVGSIDKNHERLRFSPKGKIDVVGPGRDILSTNNHQGYSTFEGTSHSTAFVTGIIALYILDHPEKILIKKKHLKY
ncbi:S8 family peptidase [Priestia flexa]|uniref:S8 family peptidase n=1 Tax=Priestia flexa TaxID=86664 RepID=UPI00288E444A|nr:S8 family peptidase [Priestia flexa]MDT2045895.1 S8 family peptidase [Priestia flexa]